MPYPRSARRALLCLLLCLASFAPFAGASPLLPGVVNAAEGELTIGLSGEGRPITAVQFGQGAQKLVIVGDTHGGPEANTFVLASQLVDYFQANPAAVPAGLRLYIIPTLNPDGLALDTRFNARGVDLNRNMNTNLDACPDNDWRNSVQGAYAVVSPTGGPYADSEVESRVLRSFLLDANGAIFLHSNAGVVFPAFCEHAPSNAMAQVYASAAGYLYNRYWQNYTITGGMHDWAGSLGIAAITPELLTGDQSEFEQNLAGVLAVLAQSAELLPPVEDRTEGGVLVPGLIWRFWKANGGAERFGLPLGPAAEAGDVTRQLFQRAALELRPRLADTPDLVQVAPLGRAAAEGRDFQPVAEDGVSRYFAETGHTLREAFLDYWDRAGGAPVLGLPISEEFTAIADDGQRRIVQYFERSVLAYYPEDGSVRPELLGRRALLRERLDRPTAAHQIR